MLEWNVTNPVPDCENLYITIEAHNDRLLLSSDNSSDTLLVELYDGTMPSVPLTLFDGYNFYEAAITFANDKISPRIHYPIQVVVPPEQVVSPGLYRSFLTVGLYSTDANVQGIDVIQIVVEVDSSQRISIRSFEGGGSSNRSTLDFREVRGETTRGVFLEVDSNSNYSLFVSSANGGELRLVPSEGPSRKGAGAIIPYDCFCGGKQIQLDQSLIRLPITPQSYGRRAASHIFSVTIYPDLKKNWAGNYEDELIFSIEPVY